MAMRGIVKRSVSLVRSMEGIGRIPRYFSDGKGRVFSEEERAAEAVYIKKMEKEKMEKQKLKAEKEKAEAEKQTSEKRFREKPEMRPKPLTSRHKPPPSFEDIHEDPAKPGEGTH